MTCMSYVSPSQCPHGVPNSSEIQERGSLRANCSSYPVKKLRMDSCITLGLGTRINYPDPPSWILRGQKEIYKSLEGIHIIIAQLEVGILYHSTGTGVREPFIRNLIKPQVTVQKSSGSISIDGTRYCHSEKKLLIHI